MHVLEKLNLEGIPHRAPTSYPSGQIWPDGTFSVGWVRVSGDERLDSRPPDISKPEDVGTDAAAPLDLRDVPNSHTFPQCPLSAGPEGSKEKKRPETYGRKGITGYGRKMVRAVGALIDRNLPCHRTTFCTITMPSMTRDARRQLASEWPDLVKELIQWLKRQLSRKGVPEVVVSVTEVQPQRLEETGEGYLHLHLLWLNRPARSGGWSVDVSNLKAWVVDWLIRRELMPCNSFVNVDVRSVKGEKSRYLAKYCSKGSSEIEELARDVGWPGVPRQWWNMSKQARNWVKANIVKGKEAGELLQLIVEKAFETNNMSPFFYLWHIDIEIDGVSVNVGWRGALVDEVRRQCVDAVRFACQTTTCSAVGRL